MLYRKPANEEQLKNRREIKGYRVATGMTVEAMAKHLGIPAFRLAKIEQGVQPCPAELALKASEVYEGDKEELALLFDDDL